MLKKGAQMKERVPFAVMISISLLIVGNLIGAGILALPIQTGLAGFIPSLLGMLVIGGAMFFSAMILSNEAVLKRDDSFNYPSLYQHYLGSIGKWIAILANLILLYGLLTAYLTGATAIIVDLFHIKLPTAVVMFVFFLIFTGITVAGVSVVAKYNALLAVFLFASFAAILLMGESHIDPKHYDYKDWLFLINIAPIAVTAFHFHNIIPTVCKSLKWNFSAIFKATLIGMTIGYVMNMTWIQVGIGDLPLTGPVDSLLAAFEENVPATVPMAQLIHSAFFVTCSLLFALLAITTSYLANGTGLMDFVNDLMENHLKNSSKLIKILVAFVPPLIISVFYPNIFLDAINVAGGVGIVILFGILPSIIAMIRFHSFKIRILSVIMLVMFTAFLVFELGQEFGFLRIRPAVESWNTPVIRR